MRCLQGCAGLPDIVAQSMQDVAAALQQLGPLQDAGRFWRRDEVQDELLTRCVVLLPAVQHLLPDNLLSGQGLALVACQLFTSSHILPAWQGAKCPWLLVISLCSTRPNCDIFFY